MRYCIFIMGMCFFAGQAWADCTSPDGLKGQIIYNNDHGVPQYCDGDKWWGMGWKHSGGGASTPAGAVMAFDLANCPSGWSAYVPAQGRVVRGIDPTGTVDPSGVRVAGSLQADELKSHNHYISGFGSAGGTLNGGPEAASGARPPSYTSGNTGGAETRMKNVALLYCRKD